MHSTWFRLFLSTTLTGLLLGGLFIFDQTPLAARSDSHQPRVKAKSAAIPAAQTPPDVQITLDPLAGGFNAPVQVTHAGDGSGRLFVVEQSGRIRIIDSNGTVLSTPFLNLSSLVSCCGGEQGLLGLAFHPNYETNGYFYVNYTRSSDGDTVIARYQVSANPQVADPGSAFTLLTIDQPYDNHNGGQLLFGPNDGYLYIGMGDGGSGGDPQNRAQNIDSLLGKMLRIDVNGGPPYSIPATNPYANSAGADEIWALGLRNPWRFSFDRANGDLYIGDVGQGEWEEVSFQAAGTPGGVNFGWRCREGAHNYNFSGNCGSLTLTDPIAEYNHNEGGNAVTGGFVYRGPLFANMAGRYFFADYGFGKIWSIYQTGPTGWSNKELELDTTFAISAFGEDEAGELYVVGYSNGIIYHLTDANGPSPNLDTSTKTISTPYADPGEVVTYTIQLKNSGGPLNQTAFLTDTLPSGLNYVAGSLSASLGTYDDTQGSVLYWQGQLAANQTVTITYRAAPADMTGSLVNQAQVTGVGFAPVTLSAALFVPRSVLNTTLADFFFPGSQPNQLLDSIVDPNSCDFCHTAPIFDRWRGSMMSQSGRDPLLWAALAVANADASAAGDYCLRCHTPKGWLEGRSQPGDGSSLHSDDISAGVACEVCHRAVDPIPSTSDEAVSIDAGVRSALTSTVPANHPGSAMLILDPQDNRRGPFAFDPDPSHPKLTLRTDFLGQGNNALTEARLCGACHNVDNPTLSWDSGRNQFWPNGDDLAAPAFDQGQLFPIETTFDEWTNSEYASSGVYAPQLAGAKPDGMVHSCQDCHMRRATGTAAENIYNPVNRDCAGAGCLPEHDLAGGNTWAPQLLQDSRWRLNSAGESAYLNSTVLRAREMLRRAATVTVTLTGSGSDKIATVRVTNETGHKLPTGYPEGRRMWLNLKAYDGNDSLIYESGAYNPATGVLTTAANTKIYEARQGITPELAAYLGLPAGGESFHFVLNNTVVKDNRIPPRGYSQAAFDRPGLRPVGASYPDGHYWDETVYTLPGNTERVVATLYYQTASKEYIDFLRANGGIDGVTLGQLWDGSKSPPEVMALAFFPSLPTYLPVIFK
ncbi:MAG: PQQ-dependent sugar dehydrogenase [Chloroflexota bacterium]